MKKRLRVDMVAAALIDCGVCVNLRYLCDLRLCQRDADERWPGGVQANWSAVAGGVRSPCPLTVAAQVKSALPELCEVVLNVLCAVGTNLLSC